MIYARFQILEGIATFAVALLAAWVLHGCDSPAEAAFLTADEKAYIINRKSKSIILCSNALTYRLIAFGSVQCMTTRVLEKMRTFHCLMCGGPSGIGRYVDVAMHLGTLNLIFIHHKVWMQILVYMSIVAPLYGCALFLP